MKKVYNLEQFVAHAGTSTGVRRDDLRIGDVLMVYTLNSVYRARHTGASCFAVSGGWFDHHHDGEVHTSIRGCTWGGSCINRAFVASPGMRVEFGNRVLTSTVQRVVHIPSTMLN